MNRLNRQKEKRMRNNFGAVSVLLLSVATVLGAGLVTFGFMNYAANKDAIQISQPIVATASIAKGEPKVTKKNIKQLDLTNKQVLTLYGEVGAQSYALAKEITELGNQSRKPIYLLINSPGSSVLDGALIVSAIEGSPVPVYTVCEQLCASMAFIIHQFGHKRLMVDRAILMAHPATGGLQGTLEQMRSRLDTIQRYVNKFDAKIANRAGLSLEQFSAKTVSEMWLDAEDSTAQGFNEEIVNIRLSPPPSVDLSAVSEHQKNMEKEKVNILW